MNAFIIVFSEEANSTFKDIQEQILNRFGDKEAVIFEKKVLKTLNLITKFPYSFELLNNVPNVHKGFIHKNCSVFYQVQESQIEVLFFWDNRQKPISGT